MRPYLHALSATLVLTAISIAAHAAPVALYVSTAGNDSWSGTLPDPAQNGQDGPFATLQRARDELRARKNAGDALDDGALVYVRGGEYYLTQTFTLTLQDSGSENAPICYMAYPGDNPILVGGRQITGFDPHDDDILRVDLDEIGLGGLQFSQLFFDGKRQILARHPNYDRDNPYAGGFLYVADNVGDNSKKQFKYRPGELGHRRRPPADGEVWIFPGTNYWNNIVPIESIDPDDHILTLAKPCSYGINKGDRYFVRGFLEHLDAPGEWYLDAENSVLYFWPPDDVTDARVSVPTIDTVIRIKGSSGKMPHDIQFHGFTIQGCDGAAVSFVYARRCMIAASTIRNAGSGVVISTGKNNLIFGNDIHHTGSSGVALYTGNRSPMAPDANRVENNYIHHTGYFQKSSSAVSCHGVGNVISHNLIHDCPRIAISFGGNDHIIEYNRCRHMNLETQDSGAIYSCARDWTERGNVIRYNYVHDTLGYGRHGGTNWHTPFFTFGIYLDDWSSGTHVYGNIVARSYLAGIDVHSGRDCVIENNIIYDCAREQMRYQAWPTSHHMLPDMFQQITKMNYPPDLYPGLQSIKHPREDATMSYNVFRRNVISYRRPRSHLYAVSGLDWETTAHDYNVIWYDGRELGKSWHTMREHGLDRHSVVADPLLMDPDNHDFRLKPGSPALEIGFEPIPVDRIGPYESPLRASWPIVEADGAREHPHKPAPVPPRNVPKYAVGRRSAPITIDGVLEPAEWDDIDRNAAMVLQQHPRGTDGARPNSYAWLCYDGAALYVGLLNEFDPGADISLGTNWGADDAAEVCLQDISGNTPGPIFVLQGFANGHFQSTDDAGAPRKAVHRIGAATQFAAHIADDNWSGEWRIPLHDAGIDPTETDKLRLNIGVRKTCGPDPWIVWVGTGSSNFLLENAGEILLKRP